MFNNFCENIIQNKNMLMLVSALIYVLALYSVFSGSIFYTSLLLTIIFIFLLMKNLLPLKYILVLTMLFYFGAINTSLRLKNVDDLLNLAPLNTEISGTILSIPQNVSEGKPKFFLKVNSIKIDSEEKFLDNEKILVTMNTMDNIEDLKIYNSGKFKGRLSAPFKSGNPSQFDYGVYLRNHNAYAVFYANEFVKTEIKLPIYAKLLQSISNYREQILSIHSKYLDSPNLEILGGIVFGDDAVSPPKVIKQSFANSGLLHILAASGMNVAFIYSFFFLILSIFRINFKLRVSLSMLTVLIYCFMTGLGASIIRATGMLMFVLIGKLIDRDTHSVSLLSFVALLMLIYNPLYINDIGFQLSFIVTFGILIMTPAIIKSTNKFINGLVGTISVPIIAQLWVIPVQIFYFNNISLYSIFANIMSTPILMVLSFGGFISSVLAGIKPIADFICKTFDTLLNPLLNILINISDFWGKLPNSSIQTIHPQVWQILLYYLILLCITGILTKDVRIKHLKSLIITAGICLTILLVSLIPIKNDNLEILAFDVGNADCFLIKTPENKYFMIDTGKSGYKGGKSQAEIIVLKYLKDKGIKNLEFIIVTHFDNDHCGGAVDLIDKLNVKRIYVNDLGHKSNDAMNIYKMAKERNTEIVLAKMNQIVYDKNGLKITNLLGESSDKDNENSIMTLLDYQQFNMLFTGDAGINGFKAILKYIPQNITVLKVPHHGALGGINKDIISQINPKYSLISVGENKFGHPSIYTLKLLKNSKVLRTDINNAILIQINKDLNIKTYNINKRKFVDTQI